MFGPDRHCPQTRLLHGFRASMPFLPRLDRQSRQGTRGLPSSRPPSPPSQASRTLQLSSQSHLETFTEPLLQFALDMPTITVRGLTNRCNFGMLWRPLLRSAVPALLAIQKNAPESVRFNWEAAHLHSSTPWGKHAAIFPFRGPHPAPIMSRGASRALRQTRNEGSVRSTT